MTGHARSDTDDFVQESIGEKKMCFSVYKCEYISLNSFEFLSKSGPKYVFFGDMPV